MIRINPDLSRVAAVFDAADAGVISLPAKVTEAATTLKNLQAATVDVPDEGATYERAVGAALAAAAAGKPMPKPVAVVRVQADAAAALLSQRVLGDAIQRAANALTAAVWASASDIMASASEALDVLFDEVRTVAPTANGNGERDDLLAGDGNSITAWRRLGELATQYRHLRAVQRVLQGEVTYDPDGQYAEFHEGVRTVWPTAGTSFQSDPPWPTSPAARLKWLATCGHRIWLPTAAQRADRWLEVHGDVEQQRRAQRRRLAGVPVA